MAEKAAGRFRSADPEDCQKGIEQVGVGTGFRADSARHQSNTRAGMIRFLQQFSTGEGDYTQSRKAWVDQTSMADLGAFVDLANAENKHGKAKKKQS